MADAILTPFDLGDAVKEGRRRYWKQILPVTEIDYDGEKVKFDPDFHKALELAATDKVYDQIPLVFADGKNQHNEDPRNFGGKILKTENRGKDGTWGLVEVDRATDRVLRKNPELGVSARIMRGVEKAGKTYPAAIRHVLMTMFPKVQDMAPWQAVDLSEDADVEVVDLTAIQYKEGNTMGDTATKTRRRRARQLDKVGSIDLSKLSDEDFQDLLDLAATATADPEDEVEDDEDDEELTDEEIAKIEEASRVKRRKKSKTKITIEKDSENDDPPGDEGDDEEDGDDESTDLSDPVERTQFQQLRWDLSEGKWANERASLLRSGVPAFLLDLADQVMASPDALTLDLADGKSVDARTVIREMLDKSKGLIDLSEEEGSSIDLSDVEDEKDPDKAFLDAWDVQYG